MLDEHLRPCPENRDHARFRDRPCADCAAAQRRPPKAAPPPDPPEPGAAVPAPWVRVLAARASTVLRRPVTAAQAGIAAVALLVFGAAGLGYASGWAATEAEAWAEDVREPSAPPTAAGELDAEPESESDVLAEKAFAARDPETLKQAARMGATRGFWPTSAPPAEPYESLLEVYSLRSRIGACTRGEPRVGELVVPSVYLVGAVAERDVDMVAALVLHGPERAVGDSSRAPAGLDAGGRTALMNAVATCAPAVPIQEEGGEAVRDEAETYAAAVVAGHRKETFHRRTPFRLGPDLADRVAAAARPYHRARSIDLEDMVRSAAMLEVLLGEPRAGLHGDAGARDDWGRTPLAYAAAFGHAAAVRRLLEAGADPNAADSLGVTPLMQAADLAENPLTDALAEAVVGVLLDAGADPEVRDRNGRRAADYVGRAGQGYALLESRTLARLQNRGGAPGTASTAGMRRADIGS